MDNPEEIRNWILKAESDYNAASELLGINSSSTDAICFHCQQAVEKYLKALLIFNNIHFARVHDLIALIELLVEKYPDIEIFKIDMVNLNAYAVDVRYPDDYYMPSKEEVVSAVKVAEKIKEFVSKHIYA